ncbi:TrmB family transcriptional regulator [Bacillus solimangrovi]|uniref:Transcriptional regulator n=1 Tax=Bacillus solimangrovi TaxID=1305675 RepID=A0A1E5LBX5_9BACI|nr:TrmB family transcriptional regulator [Bacillus solimangrovi]OEH91590.1 transcriptional regulator [Bacillus solimangrovi]
MEEIIQKLQSLGFSQYEAKAYVSLVHQGQTSAYQVSKTSGIPRARIYEILNGLEEQGIVIKNKINDSVQYSPLPVEIFLESAKAKWTDTYDYISDTLKHLEKTEPFVDNKVITLKGKSHILAYCRTILQKAEKKIIVSLWNEMYSELEHELKSKTSNCDLKGICFEVENPLSGLELHRKTSYTKNIGTNKWFILSIDGREMIYGTSINERDTAFYTDDPVHIYLLENYIWHDVLVNRIVKQTEIDMENWIAKERDDFFHIE